MTKNNTARIRFLPALALFFILGAVLRFYLFPSQILLDDEWHSLMWVIGRSPFEVLTQFNPVDNSSLPLNLYDLALYHTVGWSEFIIRLPGILAGLLSLLILPLLARRIVPERAALIFAGLLAISPVLIFYSRFARAYSFVVLGGYSAVLLLYLWQTTGRRRYAVGYIIAGAVAVYAHMGALVAVLAPVAAAIGYRNSCFGRSATGRRQMAVPLKRVLLASFIVTILVLPEFAPVFLARDQLPWHRGRMSMDGVLAAAALLSGTSSLSLNILFFLFIAAGTIWLFRHHPLLGWMFASTLVAYVVVLSISRPSLLQTGPVFLRYMIALMPAGLMLAAVAVDRLLSRWRPGKGVSKAWPALILTALLAYLFVAGPLPMLFAEVPNNFTNHSAFQGSWRRPDWQVSEVNDGLPAYSITPDQIPPFYRWLGEQSEARTIIEYPFDISNYNDLFYYYQHFHQKQVLAGYARKAEPRGYTYILPPGLTNNAYAFGVRSIDEILTQVDDPAKLRFRNLIEVTDSAAVRRSGADIIVLHKYVMALFILPGQLGTIRMNYRFTKPLAERYVELFGPPLYEDAQIICFRIKRTNSPSGQ